ncbi:hypothetical protein HMF8227_02694 [Saliniradius amylolyticus]|uniref:CopC domain-containing protein n=1 Tax=Saliniradius amylolyticus TaxID=2183582 RepID=A0A2S2E660_9ALTE|nr:hypothetical protein [Saliniradius amylolyticus]AWL13146.1 hypothetical protein HMF8227_02694 [Saliniradius amylolyticus]
MWYWNFFIGRQRDFVICCVCVLGLLSAFSALSAPGAHGPDGEHLNTQSRPMQASNPKFEAFTESFELLGEVVGEQVIVYLHDFKTNRPVSDASIELESGQHAAQATFDNTAGRYVIEKADLVNKLNRPGEHDVIATILTETSGDLLATRLITPDATGSEEHDHHSHFPWRTIAVGIGLFVAGFAAGRLRRGGQA